MSDRPILESYLRRIGVPELPATLSPFDPGYDLAALEGHLEQSRHMIASLKISMACWMIADESVSRRKVAAARKHSIPAVTGGGPFEIAVAQGELDAYLDVCAEMGFSAIEAGEGFSDLTVTAEQVVAKARLVLVNPVAKMVRPPRLMPETAMEISL